jgi:predicted dehydrogenase
MLYVIVYIQEAEMFRWGIVGAGGIARLVAATMDQLPDTRVTAVWARDTVQAARLADGLMHSRPAVPSSLEAMLCDAQIDAVYIATTHDAHYEMARRCLMANLPVLCEKPLTTCGEHSAALVALAQRKRVFLMEGLWTRCMPVYRQVADWLQQGYIGKIRNVRSNFEIELPYDPRVRQFRPDRAGGALLDLGVYNLAMTRWVLAHGVGHCPAVVSRSLTSTRAPNGVDLTTHARYRFAEDVEAQFTCGFERDGDHALTILGSRGSILVPVRFWQAEQAILRVDGNHPVSMTASHRINGYEYELEEAMRCVLAGDIESACMPHQESLALSAWLDDACSALAGQDGTATR